jgi:hypothetical protein
VSHTWTRYLGHYLALPDRERQRRCVYCRQVFDASTVEGVEECPERLGYRDPGDILAEGARCCNREKRYPLSLKYVNFHYEHSETIPGPRESWNDATHCEQCGLILAADGRTVLAGASVGCPFAWNHHVGDTCRVCGLKD